MAILRAKEIRQLTKEERGEKLSELKQELMKETAKVAPENPGRLKEIKKTIARIYTIESEGTKKNA